MGAAENADAIVAEARRLENPVQRTIMRVLTERGHYEETDDGFDWAAVDSFLAARVLEDTNDPEHELMCVLLDTGVHGSCDSHEMVCLRADVAAVMEALSDG